MDVLLRKSPFFPELTQTLDLEETETHYGKKFHNGTFIALQMKVFGHKKFQILCTWSKVPNWQFLHFCTEFENFCDQIPSFEVL
jgi:hypothetical protein